ncbi:zinc-binding dehydrogenase [Nocardia sp. NPDC059246]|uniref:zinc-binding dehydrogenase n=1 Tax=unclassified Nocardia TaxID=2637762 RepID=UPI00369DCB39
MADPVPGPGWAVLRVEAAGLCHSDLHVMHGAPYVSHTPIVLGHEVAGTILALGEGDSAGFSVGDPVGVGLLSHPHGASQGFAPGLSADGGFAELILAPLFALVPIPDGVSFGQAAVATDSIATAYHAVLSTGAVGKDQTVGVIGLGGLGLNGVAVAHNAGARVYGVDVNAAAFETARQLGAIDCFSDASELRDVRPDVIIDFAGMGTTTAAAVEAVRTGGRVVLVGLGANEVTINGPSLVARSIQLLGSLGADKDDLIAIYGEIAAGRLRPVIEEIRFSELPEGYERLERGEVKGRLVVRNLAE